MSYYDLHTSMNCWNKPIRKDNVPCISLADRSGFVKFGLLSLSALGVLAFREFERVYQFIVSIHNLGPRIKQVVLGLSGILFV